MKKNPRPNWGSLFVLIVIALGILAFEVRAPFSGTVHRILESLLVIVLYAAIWLWLRVNEGALWMEAREQSRPEPGKTRGTSSNAPSALEHGANAPGYPQGEKQKLASGWWVFLLTAIHFIQGHRDL